MTQELAKAFGLEKPQGAILADVTSGSAAEKAGLLRGDVIYHQRKSCRIKDLHCGPKWR